MMSYMQASKAKRRLDSCVSCCFDLAEKIDTLLDVADERRHVLRVGNDFERSALDSLFRNDAFSSSLSLPPGALAVRVADADRKTLVVDDGGSEVVFSTHECSLLVRVGEGCGLSALIVSAGRSQ
jgi:hypothetical protein